MNTTQVNPILWQDGKVFLIDQTRLPEEHALVEITRSEDMARAIQTTMVRGASAIGIAAAYGMYLGAKEIQTRERDRFLTQLEAVADSLRRTRPTAVNLFWAISRMLRTAYEAVGSLEQIVTTLLDTAKVIQAEDLQACWQIGEHGLATLPEQPARLSLLTHGNTGSLSTAGYGTALGVVRSCMASDRLNRLYISETRPRFQGAKLTAWECVRDAIPTTLITDSMAAHCMQQNWIDAIIVGADRIAANGDTANKIGTYALAVLAKTHQIPFYVAASTSTIDFQLADGSQIEIEQRHPSEIYQIDETVIAPPGIEFYNPAFDLTPAHWISGIVTERGTVAPSELKQFRLPPTN